jgi:hypothetical protein
MELLQNFLNYRFDWISLCHSQENEIFKSTYDFEQFINQYFYLGLGTTSDCVLKKSDERATTFQLYDKFIWISYEKINGRYNLFIQFQGTFFTVHRNAWKKVLYIRKQINQYFKKRLRFTRIDIARDIVGADIPNDFRSLLLATENDPEYKRKKFRLHSNFNPKNVSVEHNKITKVLETINYISSKWKLKAYNKHSELSNYSPSDDDAKKKEIREFHQYQRYKDLGVDLSKPITRFELQLFSDYIVNFQKDLLNLIDTDNPIGELDLCNKIFRYFYKTHKFYVLGNKNLKRLQEGKRLKDMGNEKENYLWSQIFNSDIVVENALRCNEPIRYSEPRHKTKEEVIEKIIPSRIANCEVILEENDIAKIYDEVLLMSKEFQEKFRVSQKQYQAWNDFSDMTF